MAEEYEENQLRSVALQNAQIILQARQRAERELLEAKEALEQKTAELAQAKGLLQNVFNQAAVGIARLDTNGRLLMVNPGLCDMLGYTSEELLALDLIQLMHSDDFAALVEELPQLLAGKVTVHRTEKHFLGRGGRVVWGHLTLSVERKAISTPDQFFIAVIQDITERKKSEGEVYKLASIIRSSDDAIISKDFDSTILSWNEGAERIFGFTAEEAVGQPIAILFPPELLYQETEILNKIKQGERIKSFETTRLRKDGKPIPISLTVSPIKDSNGELIGISKIARDITKRKQIEKALLESEQGLRTLADSIPQLACMAHPDGHIFWYNQRWYEYSGTTPKEVEGWGWQALHDAEILPKVIERWKYSIATGELFEMEFPLRGRDGKFRWFLTRLIPLRDSQGKILRWFGTSTDIDELRKIREERQQMLERETYAREQAEAATRAKDEFLAVVSHELRNPLNAILGYTRMARSNAHDAYQVARYCDIVERSAKSQQQLIEDLLDIARIISGKLKIEAAPTDLRLVLEEALTVVRPAAEAKQITLVTQFIDDSPPLICDAARLQQVVWNLLQNAIKFTPAGGWVELRLEQTDAHVRLIVSDSGEGIEPDFLAAVFDRFTQQDTSRTRRYGGLGLGLALVKQLVEMHGGTIEVASAGKDLGTTFTITLPLHTPPAATWQVRALAEVHTGLLARLPEDLPRLDGVRVLLVDDQDDARLMVADMLSNRGALVTAASCGREARALIADTRFDVLVCDIAMPEEDGYEVLRRIRALENERQGLPSQRLPAIALTALARTEDRLQALGAGFQLHVPKPVEPTELVVVIKSLIDRS